MITLGFTGGVGCGKTSVLEGIRDKYNCELIFTDNLAKSMMDSDEELKDKLNQEFINYNIIDNKGNIDRTKLADIVFSDKNKLEALNNIVHPHVKNRIKKIIREKESEGKTDLLIIEAALLLEEEYDKLFDCIYVYADKETRIERLSNGRGYTREKSESVINSQLSEDVFFARCKHTIDNSKDLENSLEQAYLILEKYGLRRKDGKA